MIRSLPFAVPVASSWPVCLPWSEAVSGRKVQTTLRLNREVHS
jgi:hypothetical protein